MVWDSPYEGAMSKTRMRGSNIFTWFSKCAQLLCWGFHRISVHVIERKTYSMFLINLHFSHQNIDFLRVIWSIKPETYRIFWIKLRGNLLLHPPALLKNREKDLGQTKEINKIIKPLNSKQHPKLSVFSMIWWQLESPGFSLANELLNKEIGEMETWRKKEREKVTHFKCMNRLS